MVTQTLKIDLLPQTYQFDAGFVINIFLMLLASISSISLVKGTIELGSAYDSIEQRFFRSGADPVASSDHGSRDLSVDIRDGRISTRERLLEGHEKYPSQIDRWNSHEDAKEAVAARDSILRSPSGDATGDLYKSQKLGEKFQSK